ncbi:site-specific integrase [Corynebacterium camporealensis]|uniref:site-specific integrase n=1 Tax=Corynebacterium camporealensis TaxID=161896 RepID=UPI0034CE7278
MEEQLPYPDRKMMFAEPLPEEWQEFVDLREDLLLNYRYNTARAYWNDLTEWFFWAIERDKDVLELSDKDKKQYVALLRRRKYSENTIRRRLVTLGLLYRLREERRADKGNE